MSMTDDINSIIKIKKIKQGLPGLPSRENINSNRGASDELSDDSGSGLDAPLTLEILTYDDAADVIIQATNGTFTIKTAETAKVIDANGKEFAIDTIIYAVP